ncbi:Na-translocating system protein MpsC family protein [Alkalihalobacillus sp. CinArs1]|uniref:Na-translocating system protein MpsC family protein n=1 Tax=Alkalihalobacillus sp. CinArs1 TaxID=2995314 RepID=UPI0022DD1C22|nr:Na-translocating system protein MpsC family protein [Alkalihalobacillus sp. CinArs1]
METKSKEAEISSYVGKLLRDNFGKGPSSVFVSIEKPYITIYFRDFLAPMERVLIDQKEEKRVEETRDLLMIKLFPEIKAALSVMADFTIESFYHDWSLPNRTGLFLGIMDQSECEEEHVPGGFEKKEELHEEIARISKQAEKVPGLIDSCYLNDRTIVVIREGILVRIEKELIRDGHEETLKLTKRRLEKSLMHNNNFESILSTEVQDIFVDWDFKLDKSYIVFIVKPYKS